jgi:hypothetical protein
MTNGFPRLPTSAKGSTPFHSEESNGATLPSAKENIQSKLVQNSRIRLKTAEFSCSGLVLNEFSHEIASLIYMRITDVQTGWNAPLMEIVMGAQSKARDLVRNGVVLRRLCGILITTHNE